MGSVYRTYTSNNPSGVVINPGWYALAECIISGTYPSEALLRWCGLQFDKSKPRKPRKPRRYVKPDKSVHDKVIEIYRANPHLTNTEIARIVDRSKSFITISLKKIGVKRSRWENYKK